MSKLKIGDEIRVIAPSQAWRKSYEQNYDRAKSSMEAMGFKVSFSKNIKKRARFGTSLASERASDFMAAYSDPSVKAVIALTGGWSANELLPLIDWAVITKNPKPLIGYSDITVLLNAIYAKTGTIGYLGPNFSTLGRRSEANFTHDSLSRVLLSSEPLTLTPGNKWSTFGRRKPYRNRGWVGLGEGEAGGVLIGGNLGTFYLLQGTDYLPQWPKDVILAIEDDDEAGKYTAREFDRRLESILQLPNLKNSVRGVLIGRFQPTSKVTIPDVEDIVNRKLKSIPVIANLDFGHTLPMLALPIGGKVSMKVSRSKTEMQLLEY